MGPHEQPVLLGQVACRKGQEHLHKYPGKETVWMTCQGFEESLRGKTVSFQIESSTVVAYLLKEGGSHFKTLNGLTRKILLKCHENGITVCLEYLRGVANLWADALSRGKNAQEYSLGDPACHRMFKHSASLVVNLFTSSWAHKVPNISPDLSDQGASGGDALKERWPEGIRYAFLPPNFIQMALGKLLT